jgi:hypothetical protein
VFLLVDWVPTSFKTEEQGRVGRKRGNDECFLACDSSCSKRVVGNNNVEGNKILLILFVCLVAL